VDVFAWMSEGFHEYGIEWGKRPVNFGPMRDELVRIRSEEKAVRDKQAARDIVSVADPEIQSPEWCSVSVVALAKPVQPEVNRKASEMIGLFRPSEGEVVNAESADRQDKKGGLFLAGVAGFTGVFLFPKKFPRSKK
jgi:hypothetical protein